MIARACSATPWGIDALPIEVEVDVRFGLGQFALVGLADTAVRESRERVRSAIKSCGFDLQSRSVTVSLAPADVRKEGNHLDLAIALALLGGYERLPLHLLADRLICGELGLDGLLRPVRGAMALAELAARLGARELLLPAANAAQAAALPRVPAIPLHSLSDALAHLSGARVLAPARVASGEGAAAHLAADQALDLADVRGQEVARRALEIAAAGGHNLLLLGPPGAGKSMLAARLPGLLPALDAVEEITVSKIRSLTEPAAPGALWCARPFRAPHSSASTAALLGGGPVPRPGEVTLAHAGVLFLDELPEFRRDVLEALRQPLEDGVVTVARARAHLTFPARFTLVAAMNPCACGYLGDPRHDCRCSRDAVERYRRRISGPLLDRIDLRVEVGVPSFEELRAGPSEPSTVVAGRVARARGLQRLRYGPLHPTPWNGAAPPHQRPRLDHLEPDAHRILERAYERLGLSARGVVRMLAVARTIADLAAERNIRREHIAEALQYRSLDRMQEP